MGVLGYHIFLTSQFKVQPKQATKSTPISISTPNPVSNEVEKEHILEVIVSDGTIVKVGYRGDLTPERRKRAIAFAENSIKDQ